jgi:general secretion pathway protein N
VARKPLAAAPAPWPWAIGGAVFGTLLAVVLFAPAHWLAHAIESATSGRVVMAEPRGTVWNGSAQLVLTGGPGSSDLSALPSRLDWRMRPRFTGFIVQLRTACCLPRAVRLDARWRLGGPTLKVGAGTLQLPASVLAGLGTPWNTLQLEGNLALATEGLSVEWSEGRLAMTGQAELEARNVSSRLSTLRPMGSYRITVLGGAAPSLRLDTLDGALRLAGSGQWVGPRLRFRGEATAAPDREAALSNLLNIIGRRSGGRSIITIG